MTPPALCPHCGAQDNTGIFYLCGTDSAVFKQSPACRKRQHERELAVDDEINRRRHNRKFEPDHFGT